MSSREQTKAARQASRQSDVQVTIGAEADTVDELPSAIKTVETTGDISSASCSKTRLKNEFLSASMTEERHEVQTSVASTMTPLRCVSYCIALRLGLCSFVSTVKCQLASCGPM